MCIYQPISISQRMIESFKPTRLYIKKLANFYYFGKTSSNDLNTYHGSGKKWKSIIRKYGRQNIKTLWVSDWYYNPQEIQEVALHFSKENMIVESDIWANLKPENGLDGGLTICGETHHMRSKEYQKAMKELWTSEKRALQGLKSAEMNANRTNIQREDISKKLRNAWSSERKIELSKRMKINNPSKNLKVIEKIQNSKKAWTNEYRAQINEKLSEIGKRCKIYKNGHPRLDHTIYKFENIKTKEIVEMTVSKFIQEFNLHQGNVSLVIAGKRKSVLGWRIIKD